MAKSSKSGVVVLETFDAHVKHSLLNHDDLKASDELFLIQLPNSLGLEDFSGAKFNLKKSSSNITVKGKNYKLSVVKQVDSDRTPFVPLLPSLKREKLKLSNQISSCVTIAPRIELLEPKLPPVKEKSFSQPGEIVHVYTPFGKGENVTEIPKQHTKRLKKKTKHKHEGKRSSEYGSETATPMKKAKKDANTPTTSAKKKKKKRHKQKQEEN
eukprot:m.55933 g.55933  ORF g.55933 m.55933 type:complete len:212 (+) comp7778_c1_seq2:22-657(+)